MFWHSRKEKEKPLGDNLTWRYNSFDKTLTIGGKGEMSDVASRLFKDLPIRKLVIEEGVTSIAQSAFYYHPEIKGNWLSLTM